MRETGQISVPITIYNINGVNGRLPNLLAWMELSEPQLDQDTPRFDDASRS
jgi:hypothetical protein